MASPFQQLALRRKLIYVALILVLFTSTWLWRRGLMDSLAAGLSVREESRGEVDLTGALVRRGLTGSQGLVTCLLWSEAMEQQKKNQWNDLEGTIRSLTKLQPHFITPWLFQSWNLAYNVSVESDRIRDKYFYITRGIELLAEGERQNQNHPDLRWSTGFYTQHKICQSDETNVQRSLFQLSLIPPNEREPGRFWKTNEQGDQEFNYVEFKKFCEQHPQLVRRLRYGMTRDNRTERLRQFTCRDPEAVVQFLEDNQQVPSIYRTTPPPPIPAAARGWDSAKKDELLPPTDRFPVLPPPHAAPFDREALTSESELRDETDGFAVSQSWFAYAQEPLPPAGELPGSSQPITRPAQQRRPKYMTTLIFRNYPAQGRRYQAERLQQEGWYDDEALDLSDWFETSRDLIDPKDRDVKVGGGVRSWSLEAWRMARDAWERHGQENKLLFGDPAAEQRMREQADRFGKKYPLGANGSPPPLREENLSSEDLEGYKAARYVSDLNFYRQVSNFWHHRNRCIVEAKEETVMARKLFFQANNLYYTGSQGPALKKYETKEKRAAWKGLELSPLEAWRDLVLLGNEDFRKDSFIKEQTAEIQLRYQTLRDRVNGEALKRSVERLATGLPLVPKMTPSAFPFFVTEGPFDVLVSVKDGRAVIVSTGGEPLIDDHTMLTTMERLNMTPRSRPAPVGGPETQPGGPTPAPAPEMPGSR